MDAPPAGWAASGTGAGAGVIAGAISRAAMVAGEASGDLLGALLLGEMRARAPALRAAGIGGPRMSAAGLDAWWPSERLAVFGFADALRRLPELWWLRRRLGARLLAAADRPDVFVGIDAPDFNFGLERRLRAAGVPTVHFVCPSIWAWRAERTATIRASCDHVLCLFPFEPALLERAGIAATFVGHPLADAIDDEPDRAAARAALGLPSGVEVVALLPGSRAGEVERIGPAMLDAAARLVAARRGLRLAMPVAPGMRARVDALVAARPAVAAVLTTVDGRAHEVLAACDAAIVASGTATLEAALHKRPMVVTYRVADADWRRMQRLRLQPWVALPNVLAGEFVVPERLQDAATPDALADATLAWLDDPAGVEALRRRFAAIHAMLRQGTAARAARAVEAVAAARPGPGRP